MYSEPIRNRQRDNSGKITHDFTRDIGVGFNFPHNFVFNFFWGTTEESGTVDRSESWPSPDN
jgi:hypothetical protein